MKIMIPSHFVQKITNELHYPDNMIKGGGQLQQNPNTIPDKNT